MTDVSYFVRESRSGKRRSRCPTWIWLTSPEVCSGRRTLTTQHRLAPPRSIPVGRHFTLRCSILTGCRMSSRKCGLDFPGNAGVSDGYRNEVKPRGSFSVAGPLARLVWGKTPLGCVPELPPFRVRACVSDTASDTATRYRCRVKTRTRRKPALACIPVDSILSAGTWRRRLTIAPPQVPTPAAGRRLLRH